MVGTIRSELEQTREPEVCERCGREVAPGALWTLAVALPPEGRVERDICVYCAAEVRRFLVAPAAAGPPEPAVEPGARRGARLGWFAVRSAVYVGVAAVAFVLVTWLTSR